MKTKPQEITKLVHEMETLLEKRQECIKNDDLDEDLNTLMEIAEVAESLVSSLGN